MIRQLALRSDKRTQIQSPTNYQVPAPDDARSASPSPLPHCPTPGVSPRAPRSTPLRFSEPQGPYFRRYIGF